MPRVFTTVAIGRSRIPWSALLPFTSGTGLGIRRAEWCLRYRSCSVLPGPRAVGIATRGTLVLLFLILLGYARISYNEGDLSAWRSATHAR